MAGAVRLCFELYARLQQRRSGGWRANRGPPDIQPTCRRPHLSRSNPAARRPGGGPDLAYDFFGKGCPAVSWGGRQSPPADPALRRLESVDSWRVVEPGDHAVSGADRNGVD